MKRVFLLVHLSARYFTVNMEKLFIFFQNYQLEGVQVKWKTSKTRERHNLRCKWLSVVSKDVPNLKYF